MSDNSSVRRVIAVPCSLARLRRSVHDQVFSILVTLDEDLVAEATATTSYDRRVSQKTDGLFATVKIELPACPVQHEHGIDIANQPPQQVLRGQIVLELLGMSAARPASQISHCRTTALQAG
jgi:hypothetical protein